MTERQERLRPVILCGGTGTRLWPLSRSLYPKQLLPLAAERTMLQETVARVADPERFAPPIVLCNEEHRFVVAEQLREIDAAAEALVLEPVARNTAPAIAIGALLADSRGDGAILVLPSDHVIGDPDAFLAAIETAAAAAGAGALVTFGVAPDRPETGYGYIRRGSPLDGAPGAFRVDRFVEKPDRETAERYLAAGDYLWNSGMFLFPVAGFLDELKRLEPSTAAAARAALAGAREDLDFLRLDADAFGSAPARSVDVAVMERTGRAATVPVEMGWSDLGSWSAMWEVAPKDADGNARLGEVRTIDVRGCYLRSTGPLIAAVGIEDLVLVVTDDTVLAVHRERTQDVKELVERLAADGRPEVAASRTVHRPWGSFQTIDAGDRFQAKRITVKPGGRLSLQSHRHRAEHWVVVRGTARVTRGDEVFLLGENESTYIPAGTKHRLENPGDRPLHLIEVQSGSYLGEDDIVRYEDSYGRE